VTVDPARQFVETLVYRFPMLQEAYAEHLKDYDELLPHVFMGDVTRVVVSAASDNSVWLAPLMETLEHELESGPEPVRNVILASFIENLTGSVPAIKALLPLMGPRLTDAVGDIYRTE